MVKSFKYEAEKETLIIVFDIRWEELEGAVGAWIPGG